MKKYACPCCGQLTLESEGLFDVCKVCDWQDDDFQREQPDYKGGANHISLNEAKAAFFSGKSVDALRTAAQKRFYLRTEKARKIAESRGEEFLAGEVYRWLDDEGNEIL